jgi:hypothetical protein
MKVAWHEVPGKRFREARPLGYGMMGVVSPKDIFRPDLRRVF